MVALQYGQYDLEKTTWRATCQQLPSQSSEAAAQSHFVFCDPAAARETWGEDIPTALSSMICWTFLPASAIFACRSGEGVVEKSCRKTRNMDMGVREGWVVDEAAMAGGE